jgi:glyoxylase-like metal-dependent hydrolase (beta-lactamase superfamily II)
MTPGNPLAFSRRRAFAVLAAPAVLSLARVEPARARAKDLPEQPVFRRFKLGRLTITVISDGGAMVDGPWPIVGEDRPAEEVEWLVAENLLPPKRFKPGFSPIVIDDGTTRTLIDTGNGADGFIPRPAAGRLVESLKAAGYDPADIGVVALTHCHVDHIGGVAEAGVPVFPNARYVVGAAEHAFWMDPARLQAAEGSNELKSARLFIKTFPGLRDRTTLVKPGEEVVPGVTALAAFGHTPGHLAYHVESDGRRLLVWGDCAHHEVASLAHPEWSAFFDMDKEQGKATRAKVYNMTATERLPVLGYHTSFPSLGFIARAGAGFRWIPETYQLEA